MGDVALDFCKARSKILQYMLCKNLRSPFKNSALCCFFTAFESPNIVKQNKKALTCVSAFMFWRRMGDVALDFCKARRKILQYMLCKNLRSPFKNSALCCFFTAFESPNIVKQNKKALTCMSAFLFWRRMGDSNPRARKGKRFSRPPRYDHFDNPPCCVTERFEKWLGCQRQANPLRGSSAKPI